MSKSKVAGAIVDKLFANLNHRQGYDTGMLDKKLLKQWKWDWRSIIIKILIEEENE